MKPIIEGAVTPKCLSDEDILMLAKNVERWKRVVDRETNSSILYGGHDSKSVKYVGVVGDITIVISYNWCRFYADLIGRGPHENTKHYRLCASRNGRTLLDYWEDNSHSHSQQKAHIMSFFSDVRKKYRRQWLLSLFRFSQENDPASTNIVASILS